MSAQFGEHLKFLRSALTDYNHVQMAKMLNIDRSTYTNYELGKTEPSIENLKRIAEILGVTVDSLVYWEHNKYI